MADDAPTVPDFRAVKSSNIAALAHHGTDLYVKFQGGAVWRYADVPAHIYSEMEGSGSIGKYFAQFVKPNHQATKVSG